MGTVYRCFECGSCNVFDDGNCGELVCRDCGLVLGKSEFALPFRYSKVKDEVGFGFTSLAVGTEISSWQRMELNAIHEISRVLQKLELPSSFQQTAINYVRKVRRLNRYYRKIRFSLKELVIGSVWNAIKVSNYPLSADEYVRKLKFSGFTGEKLMRMEKRASLRINVASKSSNVNLVVHHINRFTVRLEEVLGKGYAGMVSGYAIVFVRVHPGLMADRKASLVAASTLVAADWMLAKRLKLKWVAKIAKVGAGSISGLAAVYRRQMVSLKAHVERRSNSHQLKEESFNEN